MSDTTDPLAELFATQQIHTDDAGIHRDVDGREYVALMVDGETTFEPQPARRTR